MPCSRPGIRRATASMLQRALERQAESKTVDAPGLGAHQLVGQHQHRLQAKFPVAKVEQVLQARPQQVQHHHVVVPLHAVPPDVGDASCERAQLSALQSSTEALIDTTPAGAYCRPAGSCTACSRTGAAGALSSPTPAQVHTRCQTMLPTQLTGARSAQEAGFWRAPALCRPPRQSGCGCLRTHARVSAPAQWKTARPARGSPRGAAPR